MKIVKVLLSVTKYIAVAVFAIVWMVFFDRYNVMNRRNDNATLAKLKEEAGYYQKNIDSVKIAREELKKNPKSIERFAREHYFMHKDKEDIFIVEKK